MPRTKEEIIQLLRAWVDGGTSYFGTVPCLIEEDDGPISRILIEAGEPELLAQIRRLAPHRKEELERRLQAEQEARRVLFHELLRRRPRERNEVLLSETAGRNDTRAERGHGTFGPAPCSHGERLPQLDLHG